MSRLCAKALAHDIEPGYVRKLIVKRGLTPEHPVKNWPYPIRIHTLGRFELLTNDKPVTFTGKAQKKPVELLKVLIASGGKDVPEEQIIDALWPDSEGDAGHSTFNTTISRLRQLLGNDKAIQVSARAVTLDPRYCYVDAWAFEMLAQEAESKLRSKQKSIGADSEIALKISDIYRGHFLPAETASNWTVSFRERLRDKFLRLILKAGMSLEEQGCCSEAVELYRRALEADDLSEEVCQRLMSCHLQLGQQSEAVSAYKRLRQTLLKVHGITPSGRTEALHQAALMCG
jgi:DNA-binding SARP family transcriptional activator